MPFMAVYTWRYTGSFLSLFFQKWMHFELFNLHTKAIPRLWLLLPSYICILLLFSWRRKDSEQRITFTVWSCSDRGLLFCLFAVPFSRILNVLFTFLMAPEHGIEILLELSTVTQRSFFSCLLIANLELITVMHG